MVEAQKLAKALSKEFKIPYKPPNKKLDFKVCKQMFCNPKCKGFESVNKKMKNGFRSNYSTKKVAMLKKRGAISGCLYAGNYNVFHK